ncbi:PPOX class F420-dependent oxidoreductase [Saccharopolyspora dendranthemae]|uniref:PPOX class probable F420-dependent enzyme n=1 Tax=Saccharopolyspora dendranthemae TaxID=1181886 RepID=A0A561U591_9PSEU|nr:PPOX class F420-dependent oxidoreductase [Saccharopolyspora dendranthemae]TWF94527.1 PPOX class probable F420-dependent enzyme [Saccharopolyspora dendranthemae]
MDVDEAVGLIRDQHHAVLGTLREDGTPLMTPVLAAVDEQGRVVVSTKSGSGKVHNLRRDPRAWLCVLPDAFFGRWFQVDSDVEIVELPEALPLLEDYYRSLSGEHENWDSYREAMRSEKRVLLRLTPTRAVG